MQTKLEAVARAICIAVEENPDHQGDARGNEYRWQDYLPVAEKALEASGAIELEKELIDYRQLAGAVSMGLALSSNTWCQDVAFLAGHIEKLQNRYH